VIEIKPFEMQVERKLRLNKMKSEVCNFFFAALPLPVGNCCLHIPVPYVISKRTFKCFDFFKNVDKVLEYVTCKRAASTRTRTFLMDVVLPFEV